MIGLGLLVDDAIISIEMMVVKLEEGFERAKAAAYAWSHTAAPMLSGTVVTIIGFTPVGFAHSTAGEYAGNIFWIVGSVLLLAGLGMGFVKHQFFPSSDRPEVLVEVQMPEGTSIEATTAAAIRVEQWVRQQPEAKIVTTYVGQGAPRFFFSYNPELPDPAFAKLVVLTPDARARDHLKLRLREQIAKGLAPEARVRVSQLIFGPFPRYLVNFRVMGPDPNQLRIIATQVQTVMLANPHTRQVNQDWGERTQTIHFVLDQDRLQLVGLSSSDAAEQLQFLLTGVPVTQVREDIRTVEVIARSAGPERLDPARLGDLTLTNRKSPWRSRKRSHRSSRTCPTATGLKPGATSRIRPRRTPRCCPSFRSCCLTLLVLVLQTRSLSAMAMPLPTPVRVTAYWSNAAGATTIRAPQRQMREL